MRNVTAGEGYDCIVQAHNKYGWSQPSTIFTYRPSEGEFYHCRYRVMWCGVVWCTAHYIID